MNVPYNYRLVKAHAVCETAPTGADLLIDINDDGTTILGTTKLTVAAGAKEGERVYGEITTPKVAKDSNLTFDIDQIGSGVAGSDLTIDMVFERR